MKEKEDLLENGRLNQCFPNLHIKSSREDLKSRSPKQYPDLLTPWEGGQGFVFEVSQVTSIHRKHRCRCLELWVALTAHWLLSSHFNLSRLSLGEMLGGTISVLNFNTTLFKGSKCRVLSLSVSEVLPRQRYPGISLICEAAPESSPMYHSLLQVPYWQLG